MAQFEVEKSIHIHARPETVFSYFIDANKMKQWLAKQAILEPVISGKVNIDMNGRDKVLGSYVSVQPYERVSFTWGWEDSQEHPPGSSLVEVRIKPDSRGCWLHLKHISLPESDYDCHKREWHKKLARLAIIAKAVTHEQT